MREIELSKQGKKRGKFICLVDDADYEEMQKYSWHALKCEGKVYAARAEQHPVLGWDKRKILLMHRQLMGHPEGMLVDHVNENGLDNQRSNLRVCDKAKNMQNRGKQANNKSGYKGVSWDKTKKLWVAQIVVNKSYKFLGRHKTPEDAARAYDTAAREYHGEYAHTNF